MAMENQHRKISGYRELSQVEIDLMNEIKAKGEELAALCEKVDEHIASQHYHENGEEETNRLIDADPITWFSMGKMDLQTGIMKLVRSVAQPTTF
jgi:hypothetical protein